MKTSQFGDIRRIVTERSKLAHEWRTLMLVLVVADALCVLGALALAYVVRIDGLLPYGPTPNYEAYGALMVVAIPVFLTCFALVGLYTPDNLLGGIVEYKQVAKGGTVGLMLLVVYTVFTRNENFDVSRLWLVLSWVLTLGFVGVTRFFIRRLVYALRASRGVLTSRVMIVGANDQGVAIAEQWMRAPASGMRVIGFLDDFKAVGTTVVGNAKVIGRPSALDHLSREYNADEVIVVSTAVAWESFGEIVTANGANKEYVLRLSPGFYDLLTTGVAVTNKTFVPLLTINESRIVGVDAVLKWLLDYGLGAALAIITLPISIAMALTLKLRNPGMPVIRRFQMNGRGGAAFTMHQFNTSPATPVHADVARHTRRFERFVRFTGLHKLPQLLDVLSGRMSLVGPRPRADVNHVTDMHTMHNLLAVKPGVVGPWVRKDHLRSPNPETDELNYVRNWQIWLDLPILFEAMIMLFVRMGRAFRGAAAMPVAAEQERSPRRNPKLNTTLSEDALH
jgi:lipopolysaccharide/colanic/teichoic acid biosynthesis glycosyltransferase